ncbi:MAG: class II aldolase/adducin family protein [Phycisphaerae bacterium]
MADEWQLRQEICQIGRRLYARGFVAANDGNISARLDDRRVLCTPTLVSKGFMRPEDICTVQMNGRQLAGPRQHTSELPLHLAIYRARAEVGAVVHAHPPHATAFAVAGIEIPTGILPEVEILLGPVPTAAYETPGTEAFAQTVLPYIQQANAIVLKNHGTVSLGADLQQAWFRTEIIDAYCRVLILARQLGNVDRLSRAKLLELLQLKQDSGLGTDPRLAGAAELYINPRFGQGCGSPDVAGQG